MDKQKQNRRKLVVIGDGGCGKTCLLMAFKGESFPEDYVPTVFETYVVDVTLPKNNRNIELALWDTAGQEEYDRLRPISYPDTNVLLICYDISNRHSYENISQTWLQEAVHHCPKVPIVLVGLKEDLRTPDAMAEARRMGLEYVTTEEGMRLSHEIKAAHFAECSARERTNVPDLLTTCAKIAFGKPKKSCDIL